MSRSEFRGYKERVESMQGPRTLSLRPASGVPIWVLKTAHQAEKRLVCGPHSKLVHASSCVPDFVACINEMKACKLSARFVCGLQVMSRFH